MYRVEDFGCYHQDLGHVGFGVLLQAAIQMVLLHDLCSHEPFNLGDLAIPPRFATPPLRPSTVSFKPRTRSPGMLC